MEVCLFSRHVTSIPSRVTCYLSVSMHTYICMDVYTHRHTHIDSFPLPKIIFSSVLQRKHLSVIFCLLLSVLAHSQMCLKLNLIPFYVTFSFWLYSASFRMPLWNCNNVFLTKWDWITSLTLSLHAFHFAFSRLTATVRAWRLSRMTGAIKRIFSAKYLKLCAISINSCKS